MNRIITIGGSAGGLQALLKVIAALDDEHPCALFVVLHGASEKLPKILSGQLQASARWEVELPKNSASIEPGRIYVAPPDRHMLIQKKNVVVNKGPRVNRSRPAIDLLFRSAAVAYDSAVIGVILSGLLNDGVAGVQAIKQCGGTAIIQDPDEALHPDLPENVIRAADVNYIKKAREIGPLLNELGASSADEQGAVPEKIALENRLDLNNEYSIELMDQLGEKVSFSCPECGGPLWELADERSPRYRCHSGHSLTIDSLLKGKNSKIEKTLRVALRSLEEKKRVQDKLNSEGSNKILKRRLSETGTHVERLRKLVEKMF